VTTPGPIQCSTGPFWAFDLEHALDLVAEAGFEAVELMVTRDPKTHDPETVARLAAERSLSVAAVHGPFLVLTRTVWGLGGVGKVARGLEFCRALGASTLVVHPPLLWEDDYARWLERSLASPRGPVVAVETMYPRWVAGQRLRAYRWVDPARLVRSASALVLDTSHVAVARVDLLEAFRVLSPRLVHIHLSDNAGDGRDGHLAIGDGILPLAALLAEIRRGYRGTICLELSAARYAGRPKELVTMLRRNRELVCEVLEESPKAAEGPPRTRERPR
jgi:sugar phosphate isomerase/epimerase